jgi:hypothetical protein
MYRVGKGISQKERKRRMKEREKVRATIRKSGEKGEKAV